MTGKVNINVINNLILIWMKLKKKIIINKDETEIRQENNSNNFNDKFLFIIKKKLEYIILSIQI